MPCLKHTLFFQATLMVSQWSNPGHDGTGNTSWVVEHAQVPGLQVQTDSGFDVLGEEPADWLSGWRPAPGEVGHFYVPVAGGGQPGPVC